MNVLALLQMIAFYVLKIFIYTTIHVIQVVNVRTKLFNLKILVKIVILHVKIALGLTQINA
jgi:hypothetical protein